MCSGCQTPFSDGQAYFAALVFDKEGYQRGDFCQACWEARSQDGSRYSMWHGVFRMPPPEPEEPLRKETAESLLRRLIEQEDPATGNVIYILAVMLERTRLLVEKDIQTRDDGVMIRVYEHRKTGETFLIADPRLQLDQLEAVQQQVMDMLGVGKDQPVAEKSGTSDAPPAGTAQPAAGDAPAALSPA